MSVFVWDSDVTMLSLRCLGAAILFLFCLANAHHRVYSGLLLHALSAKIRADYFVTMSDVTGGAFLVPPIQNAQPKLAGHLCTTRRT